MKRFLLLWISIFSFSYLSFSQVPSIPPSGGNQKSTVRQYIGSVAYVEITYSSPDVAGREGAIWGQLVPYGLNNLGFGSSSNENPSPWRAGANENTTIEFSHDMVVQDEDISAGTYGFHMIPKEEGLWTLIFSSESESWGSFFYNPMEDVLRVETEPMETEFTEFLTYEFGNRTNTEATVSLVWENKAIPFTILLADPTKLTITGITSDLKGSVGFSSNNWNNAAIWALSAGKNEKALEWAESSISLPFIGQKSFTNLFTKYQALLALEKSDEANKVMDEAIKLSGATAFQIHAYARQLITSDQKKKALEVFKYNHEKFDGVWPTNYGLARGYSAMGDFKKAIKYLEEAKKNVPSGDTINPPIIDSNMVKLKNEEDIN